MAEETKREQSQVEVSMPIQLAGFGLLILFAGTFGGRWAVLAGALVLLFVGFVLSGVKVSVSLPAARPAGTGPASPDGGR
jgi:hypothetical protein